MLAHDLVLAFNSQDEAALQRVNAHYERAFTFDDLWAEIWRRVYAFRQRSSRVPKNYLQLDEAQMVIAQDAGFGSWAALTRAVDDRRARRSRPTTIDTTENRIAPRRHAERTASGTS